MNAPGTGPDIEGAQQARRFFGQCAAETVDVAINAARTNIIGGEKIARCVSALDTAGSTY